MDCTRLMLSQDLPEPVLHQLLSTVLIARRGTDSQSPSQADNILCQISACLGHSDIQPMLHARFASIMSAFDAGCPSTWTADSKSWRVLVSVADRLDVLDAGVTKTICSVVSLTGQPEMRLKCFQMLAALVQRAELVDGEILATVLDVMVDNIKWKAGRTSSSLRSSAVLCLSYIVNKQLESVKVAGRSRILEGVLPLVEDDAQATRIFVCGIVGAVCSREDIDRVFKREFD